MTCSTSCWRSGEPAGPPASPPSSARSGPRRGRQGPRWWSRPAARSRVGVRRLRRGRRLRTRQRRGARRHAPAGALRDHRRRRVRRRAHLRRDHRHLRRAGVAQHLSPSCRPIADDIAGHRPVAVATVIAHPDPRWVGRRLVVGPDSVDGSLGSTRADAAVADDARGPAGRGPQRRCSPTAPTASAAARAWRCSWPAMRRGRGCWCSAPSTSPPPSPGRARFLGYRVTVCDARPGVRDARRGSRPPTRSSSTGRNRYLRRAGRRGRDRLAHRRSAC